MAANSRAALVAQRVAAWNQAHPDRPIDLRAELAVAAQEGLGGGIGDGGHAFGPNQLNNAGGVLTGKFGGQSPEQIQRWAWSPQGIDYALAGVAKAAGGLKGRQAVDAIVTQFERPLNPGREVQNARAAYGLPAGTGAGPPPQPGGSVAAALSTPQNQQQQAPEGFRPQLLAQLGAGGGDNYQGFYQTLGRALRARSQGGSPQLAQQPTVGGAPSAGGYQMPLTGAKINHLDQGIDYQGRVGQTVNAVGDGTVQVKADPGGFGQAVYETLTSGPRAGQQIYVGHAQPNVKTGQSVRAGQPLATLLQRPLGNATQPGWAEIGFARNGAPAATEGENSPQAQQFLKFLQTLGAK